MLMLDSKMSNRILKLLAKQYEATELDLDFVELTHRVDGFGGVINFFLSETLNLGLEGTYYVPQQQEHYFLRGLDDRERPVFEPKVRSVRVQRLGIVLGRRIRARRIVVVNAAEKTPRSAGSNCDKSRTPTTSTEASRALCGCRPACGRAGCLRGFPVPSERGRKNEEPEREEQDSYRRLGRALERRVHRLVHPGACDRVFRAPCGEPEASGDKCYRVRVTVDRAPFSKGVGAI